MQSEILERYSSDSLRVYAVWLPMMWSDSREKWDGATMPDPRVRHYWDGDLIAGKWFADEVETWRAIAWDVYYLYGPDATWDTIPQPLLGVGGDIINARENLRAEIEPLLRDE